MDNRRSLLALAVACTVCFACPFQGREDREAIAANPKQPDAVRLASLLADVKLNRGKKKAFRFFITEVPRRREMVLLLSARLNAPKVAGHAPALRLTLNGTPLDGNRLVNKPLRVRARGGPVYSMSAGDCLTTYYSPDFASPDTNPYYGLLGGVKACAFELRVTELLRHGENELVVENAAPASVTNILVVAGARIESRPLLPRPEGRAGAPTGRLPVYQPRSTFHTEFRVRTLPDAQIEMTVGDERMLVCSSFSTPKPQWVHASSPYFRHARRVEPKSEAILVFDTFTNLTDENLPLMHRHEAQLGDRLRGVWLAGLERPTGTGRTSESSNPAAFAATTARGIGLIALDDVFRVHYSGYARDGSIGIADNSLVLQPGAKYTAKWAIVPTDAPDYWRFLNAARRLVNANFTIPGGFAFLRASRHIKAWSDQQVCDFLRFKDVLYACASIDRYKGRYAHGTAFQQAQHEPCREAFTRRRRLVPGVQHLVYFHCFLDTTDEAPKRFADARTLRADGRQADYGQLHQRLFFPTESNSYGAAITRNVDVILDEIGADGVYWDEHEYSACAYHYGPPWDGASGDIDPRKMTLRRLKSSVILLSEPWRLAMAKRILARGPLVGNGVPRTRAMANLRFPCFVETGSISHCTKAHLYSPIALGDHRTERSEEDAYQTMLAALDYGCVYYWYNDIPVVPTHHHLTRYMYPITPLELHEGLIIGKERIITKKSGLFGWGDRSQHEVHVFDHQGRQVEDYPAPTIERNHNTYTELRLPKDWSAAVVRR